MLGQSSEISCGTSSSSFLNDLHANKTVVSIQSTQPLQSSITIDSSNDTLSFTMKVDGAIKAVDIKLTAGTYNRETLVTEINKQLNGHGVKASLNGNNLQLTADQRGAGSELIFDSQNGGSDSGQGYAGANCN